MSAGIFPRHNTRRAETFRIQQIETLLYCYMPYGTVAIEAKRLQGKANQNCSVSIYKWNNHEQQSQQRSVKSWKSGTKSKILAAVHWHWHNRLSVDIGHETEPKKTRWKPDAEPRWHTSCAQIWAKSRHRYYVPRVDRNMSRGISKQDTCLEDSTAEYSFYSASALLAMHTAVIVRAVCLSVCLYVRHVPVLRPDEWTYMIVWSSASVGQSF